MAGNLNKVFGAIALSGVSGALTKISSDLLRVGDVGLVVTSTNFYVFVCDESGDSPSNEPFSTENLPLILKPEDEFRDSSLTETNKRWKLTSLGALTESIRQKDGNFIQTTLIKGHPTLTFLNGSDVTVSRIESDGSFWINKLKITDTGVVSNLNSEYLGGQRKEHYVLRNGTQPFLNPISGQDPIAADHLTTKRYVDDKLNLVNPEQFIKRDGTVSFLNPVMGMDPENERELTTKRYVDDELNNRTAQILETIQVTNYVNGLESLSEGITEYEVIFQNNATLPTYSVNIILENTEDEQPSFYNYMIINKTTTSFVVKFSSPIDSNNYKLNWVATLVN